MDCNPSKSQGYRIFLTDLKPPKNPIPSCDKFPSMTRTGAQIVVLHQTDTSTTILCTGGFYIPYPVPYRIHPEDLLVEVYWNDFEDVAKSGVS